MPGVAAFEDMEAAACCILRIIKDTPDLARSTKVAIAGEMAVRKYLPQCRQNIAGVSPIILSPTIHSHPRLTRIFPTPSKA